MEHTKHLWRAGLILVALFVVLVLGRHLAVPETFGEEGFYRASSRMEFMRQSVMHGNPRSCAECHEEEQEQHDSGKHATVSCEVCHAPLSDHVAGGEKIADMPADPTRHLCGLCHLQLQARPKDFPQILPGAHLVDQGALEPGDPVPERGCALCHPPHNPLEGG